MVFSQFSMGFIECAVDVKFLVSQVIRGGEDEKSKPILYLSEFCNNYQHDRNSRFTLFPLVRKVSFTHFLIKQ